MSNLIRAKTLEGLEDLGIKIDERKNSLAKTRNMECEISHKDSNTKIYVIPTDEERVLIEDVVTLMEGSYDEHTKFKYGFQKSDYLNSMRCADFEKEYAKKPELKDVMANHMKTLLKDSIN